MCSTFLEQLLQIVSRGKISSNSMPIFFSRSFIFARLFRASFLFSYGFEHNLQQKKNCYYYFSPSPFYKKCCIKNQNKLHVRFRFSRFFSFAEIKKDFVTEKARDINIRGEELERCFWLASQIMPKCCVWIDHITL